MFQVVDQEIRYGETVGKGENTCRVRIFTDELLLPVVICSDLDERSGWSITNACEYLAAQVYLDFAPMVTWRLTEQPFIWLENYGPVPALRHAEEYSVVTFAGPRPTRDRRFRGDVWRLDRPTWRSITTEAVHRIIGIPFEERVCSLRTHGLVQCGLKNSRLTVSEPA